MERTTRTMSLAGVLTAVALGAAACGGSSGGSYGGSASPSAPTSRTSTGSSNARSTAPHLTTSQGLSVYLFAPDKPGRSTCYGGCASVWPPVPAGSKLAATSGAVSAKLLGTTTRTDGSKQLTYAGHPLYRYIGDSAAGDAAGQGLNASGGLWWLVSAKGAAIMTGGTVGGSSPSGGSGGGGY